jgi:hypothetical protein
VRKTTQSLILLVLIAASALDSFAQKQLIADEVARLRRIRSELNPKNDNSAFDVQFRELESDLAADRLYAALYKLQTLWLAVSSFSFDEKKSAVVQDKLPLLEVEWKNVGEDLQAKEKRFSPALIKQLPAVARGIIEASRHRSSPLYRSSILYAKNTNPNQGLYYLGNARANVDLALFTQNLRFEPKKTSLKFVSLERELTQVEREIIDSYRRSTPEEQNRYNALNAALKLARELNDRGWFEGAALKYFDVLLAFGLLKNPSVNAGAIPDLRAKLNEQSTVLSTVGTDHSLGLTFLQTADGLLTLEPVNESALKRATVILNEVLPAYRKIFEKGSK